MQRGFNSDGDMQEKHNKRLEHFKIEGFNCSKCLIDGDDSHLRKFKKKVYEKFKLDQFKIFNSQGILISESDLYFVHQEGLESAVVYVSQMSNLIFLTQLFYR